MNPARKPSFSVKRENVEQMQIFAPFLIYLNNFLDCPPGWFLYAGYCYALLPEPTSFHFLYWSYYDLICSLSQVSISSSHEHAYVLTLLADMKAYGILDGNDVWLGLERKGENRFNWVNGDSLRCSAMKQLSREENN